MNVSVIIPTLNEARILPSTLTALEEHTLHEIIIGDGGSTDETVAIARRFSAKVVDSAPGRAVQMNAAAREATGDLLLFLHADSRILPEGFRNMVAAMRSGNYLGGAFSLHIDSDTPALRTISRLATLRSRYLHLVYGDQAFFVRPEVFHALDGFASLPICEDLEFFRRLKRQGPVVILPDKAFTSARRWLAEGVAFTTARNIAIAALFLLGFPPSTLSKWYLPRR